MLWLWILVFIILSDVPNPSWEPRDVFLLGSVFGVLCTTTRLGVAFKAATQILEGLDHRTGRPYYNPQADNELPSVNRNTWGTWGSTILFVVLVILCIIFRTAAACVPKLGASFYLGHEFGVRFWCGMSDAMEEEMAARRDEDRARG